MNRKYKFGKTSMTHVSSSSDLHVDKVLGLNVIIVPNGLTVL